MYSKKSKFTKKQDAKGLLSNLGIKTPLSKIPVLGDILFWMQFHWMNIIMNEIVNKFLLVGDKFMPEMPGLIIVLVEHLLKIEKEFKSLKKQDVLVIFTKMN